MRECYVSLNSYDFLFHFKFFVVHTLSLFRSRTCNDLSLGGFDASKMHHVFAEFSP